MHELSLCRALIASAEKELSRHPGCALRVLKVSIGALSGCEPDLLAQLFSHASPGTCAANATLEIEFQPVSVRCIHCGKTSTATPSNLCCPTCSSNEVQLAGGDGVFLTGLTLTEAEHVQ